MPWARGVEVNANCVNPMVSSEQSAQFNAETQMESEGWRFSGFARRSISFRSRARRVWRTWRRSSLRPCPGRSRRRPGDAHCQTRQPREEAPSPSGACGFGKQRRLGDAPCQIGFSPVCLPCSGRAAPPAASRGANVTPLLARRFFSFRSRGTPLRANAVS